MFDPIPYGAIAWESAISDAYQATISDLGLGGVVDLLAALASSITGGYISGAVAWTDFVTSLAHNIEVRIPDFSHLTGCSLEGEIASTIEHVQTPLSASLLGTSAISATAPCPA